MAIEDEGEHIMVQGDDYSPATPVRSFDNQGAAFDASFIDIFRQEQAELAAASSVFIEVKGYERTGLQIKYRMPESGRELADIARKIQRQYKDDYSRTLFTSMDVMIYLCDGLYVQPEGVDEPVMLDPQETGEPCLFDERLAQIIGMNGEVKGARAVVKGLFGGNELMIVAHYERLNRWLQNTKADIDSELWQMGE